MSIYNKIFSKILQEETDAEILKKSMDKPEDHEQLQTELDGISDTAQFQNDEIIQKAEHYALKITEKVLPMMRKLHSEIVSGAFQTIAPNIKGISKINEDLAGLAEALRGRVNDAVIQTQKQQ